LTEHLKTGRLKRRAVLAGNVVKWFAEKIVPVFILLIISWLIWVTTQIFDMQQALAVRTQENELSIRALEMRTVERMSRIEERIARLETNIAYIKESSIRIESRLNSKISEKGR
jgi:ribosomal protein L31E